jgi:hypothetical protein
MYRPRSVQPRRRGWRKALVVAAGVLAVLVLVVASLCCFFGIHSTQDLRAYGAMTRGHFHPVWKDLAWRCICKGDSVESLLKRYPPVRREDFGPYTQLYYAQPGSFDTLGVLAKNARLIHARAGSCTWEHIFFTAPEEEEALSQAYAEYAHQRVLEGQAYRIHRTIVAGQDVFLSGRVERSQVRDDPNESEYSAELIRQMREIYGQAYLDSVMTHLELTVEVTKVLYGDLEPGTVLKFRGDNCGDAGLNGPETVFLHVEDSRILYPHSRGGETYVAVPRKALDWYLSLNADEVKKLEALRRSGSTGTVK